MHEKVDSELYPDDFEPYEDDNTMHYT